MAKVAVVAHARKSLGGGLRELRGLLARTSFRIRFDREFPHELDGGARPAVRDLHIKVHPRSVTICVPA